MKTARFLLIAFACLLAGCDSSRLATTPTARRHRRYAAHLRRHSQHAAGSTLGMFTFRSSTSRTQQDVFVTFQGNSVIFSSFEPALSIIGYQPYTYFYGVGLK